MAIHTAFAQTEHGQRLASRVRYEKYKPAEVGNEQWVALLGADVNNLTHLTLTYGLTRSLIARLGESDPGMLTPEEEQTLQTAALIHDWAEAIVGDISFGDKTAEDEAEERRQLIGNLNTFFPGGSDEAVPYLTAAIQEVIFAPETKLGRLFNAIERVGYVRTALRAAQHAAEGAAPECREGFRWIVADVLSNQPAKLMEYAVELVPVRDFLLNQRQAITTAFDLVSKEVFQNYEPERQTLKEAEFTGQYQAWHDWLATVDRTRTA